MTNKILSFNTALKRLIKNNYSPIQYNGRIYWLDHASAYTRKISNKTKIFHWNYSNNEWLYNGIQLKK